VLGTSLETLSGDDGECLSKSCSRLGRSWCSDFTPSKFRFAGLLGASGCFGGSGRFGGSECFCGSGCFVGSGRLSCSVRFGAHGGLRANCSDMKSKSEGWGTTCGIYAESEHELYGGLGRGVYDEARGHAG
jgi:hypothetical protein